MTTKISNQTRLTKYFATKGNENETEKANEIEEEKEEELVDYIPAFGDDIAQRTEGEVLAAFQNVNGLKELGGQLNELQAMEELSINILGISETNYNATHDFRIALTKMIYQQLGVGAATTASHRSDKAGYLPGGTSLIIQGPTTGRIKERIVDKMGRYSADLLEGKQGSGILCCSIYRVCQKKGAAAGPLTSYTRQFEELSERGIKNPDPRKQTLTDLTKLIQEHAPQGYHPMIMGDFNDLVSAKEIQDFMDENQLIDIIGDMHEGTPPATYARGSKRLDYVLGDQHVRDAARRSGYLALHDGVISDHTMGWVAYDQQALFRNTSYTPVAPPARQFTLKNTEKKRQFIEELEKIHKHQSIQSRVLKLETDFASEGKATPELIARFISLDNEIKESMIAAANKIGRKNYGYQRSEDLIDAGRRLNLAKGILSCIRNKMKWTNAVCKLAELTNTDLNESRKLTRHEARAKAHEAREQLKKSKTKTAREESSGSKV